MNVRLALLLTNDGNFEKVFREALAESGATILVTRNVADALEIGRRRGTELDLAVIDCDDCHTITLLSAIHACCSDLPIVVITSSDSFHCAALAYANGAAAYIGKPTTTAELKLALRELCRWTLQLGAV